MGNCSSKKNLNLESSEYTNIIQQYDKVSVKQRLDHKHKRYNTFNNNHKDKLNNIFWGIGLENECYLMFDKKRSNLKDLQLKRERYSVDYFTNFDKDKLEYNINHLKTFKNLTYPVYINSHTFEKTDIHNEHKTKYDTESTPNYKFKESIFDVFMKQSEFFKNEYNKSIVFDGDSIEFITQNFLNTTTLNCVQELINIKQKFIEEFRKFLKQYYVDNVKFPDHNYGLVSFLTTNYKNLGICNNGTYHINITLPTYLKKDKIIEKKQFIYQHINFIKAFQLLEGIIIATYGTPDIFSLVDDSYSIGSLRASLSRYISLLTFDTKKIKNGKQLQTKITGDEDFWYNIIHKNSPYIKNKEIGFDINFNKFKNHGVELRIFDWFPEKYLLDFLNFIVLLAQHTINNNIDYNKQNIQQLTAKCVKYGYKYLLSIEEANMILYNLKINLNVNKRYTAHHLLNKISNYLYNNYNNEDFVNIISPQMKKPFLVNYNYEVYKQLYTDLFGKHELILRSEIKKDEYRTPLIPEDIKDLLPFFDVYVEENELRCFSIEEYKKAGANIVEKGFWKNRKNAIVLGLKELDDVIINSQIHLYFSHSFKKQINSDKILQNFSNGILLDFEYFLNEENKRVLSFGSQSGKIGCMLGLCRFFDISINNKFDEKNYVTQIYQKIKEFKPPTVLIIGNGRVSSMCQNILNMFNISYNVWGRKETKFIDKGALLKYNILLNTISLDNKQQNPFLINDDITKKRNMKVIVDISCDYTRANNPLPLYNHNTNKEMYITLSKNPPLYLIAIDNLPSLQPIESSTLFSKDLKPFLKEILNYRETYNLNYEGKVLYRAENIFSKLN